MPVSNNTCLRLIKSMSMQPGDNLLCIGIDDWAKKKGRNYGTIIVNSDTGRPVDLLDSRESGDVAEWLSRHKEIKYVTRNQATSYANAISKAIPEAKQIADRFHLVKKLSDAIQEEIKREYMNLKQVCKKVHEDSEVEKSTEKFSKIHSITPHHVSGNGKQEISSEMIEKREKLVQMINMKENGHSISEIARKTQTHWVTVKRYLAHGIPSIGRTTRVNYDIYTAEIEQMCSLEINPTAMFRSLKTIGLRCCERSFSRWFHLNFPDYEHKWNRTYPEPLKVTKPRLWP